MDTSAKYGIVQNNFRKHSFLDLSETRLSVLAAVEDIGSKELEAVVVSIYCMNG